MCFKYLEVLLRPCVECVLNVTCSMTGEVRKEIIKMYRNLLKKGMERSSVTLVKPKSDLSTCDGQLDKFTEEITRR